MGHPVYFVKCILPANFSVYSDMSTNVMASPCDLQE